MPSVTQKTPIAVSSSSASNDDFAKNAELDTRIVASVTAVFTHHCGFE
jgi:hypothetical protein